MIPDFKIDSAKITEVAAAFSVSEASVKNLYEKYAEFSPHIQAQPLAHIMRGIECYFRKKLNNSGFIVVCEPYSNLVSGQKLASADYFQGKKFVINYSRDLPEEDLRVYVAHEVGHLFLLAEIDVSTKDKRKNMYTGTTEPLCSIFGVFAVSEKSDFYANHGTSGGNYKDWKEILSKFVGIHGDDKAEDSSTV